MSDTFQDLNPNFALIIFNNFCLLENAHTMIREEDRRDRMESYRAVKQAH